MWWKIGLGVLVIIYLCAGGLVAFGTLRNEDATVWEYVNIMLKWPRLFWGGM